MKKRRLKNIRDRFRRPRRTFPGLGSVLALVLAVLTLMPSARAAGENGAIPVATLPNKPEVTIQGNVVVDEGGAPTGFYELALCVRSPRRIYGPNPTDWTAKDLTEAEYAQALAAIEAGTAGVGVTADSYQVTYYPFSAASAVVNVNADVLTAVHWDVTEVQYTAWDGAKYTDATSDAAYPRGVDVAASAPTDQWGPTDPDPFPNVTLASMDKYNGRNPVSLDTEGDRSTFTAAAQVDKYYVNPANNTKTAIVTLSAHAPDNKPVVYKTSTPVVVVRFSYDLKRFPKGIVKVNETYNAGQPLNQITGSSDPTAADGFWLGLDRGYGNLLGDGKTPLTWLADRTMGTGGTSYDYSDQMAAMTEDGQAVWTKLSSKDTAGAPVDWSQTEYYYYLGARAATANGSNGTEGTEEVYNAATDTFDLVEHIKIPTTEGEKVLGHGTEENPVPNPGDGWFTPQFSYYSNILYLDGAAPSLKLRLVNDLTFKKPTGTGGGLEVLFYDWDDTLIGATNVSPKGDVRKAINDYVEKNLVHPDLRSSATNMADGGGKTREEKFSSLDREYTYRGKYAYIVGGDDDALGVANGPEYPLTNKLDYVFTKRINTCLTQAESGADVCYVHPYALSDPDLDPAQDAETLYPYVYGWAVVEDDSAFNGRVGAAGTAGPWKSMHDAAKLEDTWTTMGVGELSNAKPGNIDVPTPPTATVPDPTLVERTAPSFLVSADATWTDGTRADADVYGYTLSGESGYLRFADFSDIGAEMARYSKKDTLIVKAVYEPGTELLSSGYLYRLDGAPYYNKLNRFSADKGGAYSVELTLERASVETGPVKGVTRVRDPAIRQDTTIDYKWIVDEEKGVNNDLDNADISTAMGLTQTTYTKVEFDNGESVTFTLSLSARQNKVDYFLIEAFESNFVSGGQRSYSNYYVVGDLNSWVQDNYNYLSSDSETTDDLYDADFQTRSGSRGFVLDGTLNRLMEYATKQNHGQLTNTAMIQDMTYSNMADANLHNPNGSTIKASDEAAVRTLIFQAAAECEAKGTADYWNAEKECAQLTYHQLQLYIQGNGLLPRDAAEAIKIPFCHYHVSCTGGHVPAPPTNWAGLMAKLREHNAAALGSDDRKHAKADLDAMDLATLESITGLRADGDGKKFTTAGDVINALLSAEGQLNAATLPVSWVNLQYTILQGAPGAEADMLDAAQNNYFWHSGANAAPKVNDFAGLLAAADTARTPVTLKDGSTTFLPKSALSKAQFPADAEAYLTNPTPTRAQRNAWVALTHNLVPSHSETPVDPDGTPNSGDEYTEYAYGKFADMATVRTQFTTIYNSICDAGGTLPADETEWWKEIQTKMLPDGDNLGDDTGDGSNKFWWKDGNTPFKISNLSTLVEAARRLNNAATDPDAAAAAQKEWDRLTVAEIEGAEISQSLRWKGTDAAHPMYPNAGASLGADEATQKAVILNQLKSAVSRFDAALAANPGLGLTWNGIQYLLLNDTSALPADPAKVDEQAAYYWWKDGNTAGTTVSLSTSNTEQNNVRALIAATYRADFNDPGVTSSILAATQAQDNSFWAYTKLITQKVQGSEFDRENNENDNYDGPDTEAEAKAKAYPGSDAADVEAMLTMLSGFRDKAKQALGVTDAYAVPAFLWQQVQYYVLNGETYLAVSDPIIADLSDMDKALAGDYWWYYDTIRHPPDPPAPPPANEPSQDFVDGPLKTAVGGGAAIKLTSDEFAALGITGNAAGTTPVIGACNKILNKLVTSLQGTSYVKDDGTVELSWVQLQYYFATAYKANKLGSKPGTLADSATALAGLVSLGFDPANFPAGVKTTFSLRSADTLAVDMDEGALFPSVDQAAQPPAGEQGPATQEDIQAQIDALEQRIEALEQELAGLKAQLNQAQQAVGADLRVRPRPSTPTPTPSPTPAEDEDPSVGADVPIGPEPATTPEVPAEEEPTVPADQPEETAPAPADDHDERPEIPLGEEAQAAVRSVGMAGGWMDRLLPKKIDFVPRVM